jgi:hypothetical protein
MKKTLLAFVLASICFSLPVLANAERLEGPAAETTIAANSLVTPVFAQIRIRVGGRNHRRRNWARRRWAYRRYRRYHRG